MRLYQKTVIIIFLVSFILVVSGCKQNTVEKTVSTTPSEVETGNLLEEELQKQDEDRAALISFWEQNREDMIKNSKPGFMAKINILCSCKRRSIASQNWKEQM